MAAVLESPVGVDAFVMRGRRLGNAYFAVRARERGVPFVQLPPGVPSVHDLGRGCVFAGVKFNDQLTPHFDAWLPGDGLLYAWLATQDLTIPGEDSREAYPYRAR